MKALVWTGRNLELQIKSEPQIRKEHDVKVRISYAGICGTDLNIVKGVVTWPSDRIIGHEAVGEVVDAGAAVEGLKIGDKVVIDPTQFCGRCRYCRSGFTNFCERFGEMEVGNAVDGVFAEFFVTGDSFIYKIPDGLRPDIAVMTEPLACVLHNIEESHIQSHESVLVVGGGPIGALCGHVAKKAANVTMVTERDPYRLDFLSSFGLDAVDVSDADKAKRILRNAPFDVVIDTVGNQMHEALPYLGKGGRYVIMGIAPDYVFPLSPNMLLSKGISLVGVGEYHLYMEKSLKIIARDPDIGLICTSKKPLEEYESAFAQMTGTRDGNGSKTSRSSMKTLLTFQN
jgi:threonine dehydrogenase-like Zn-dependent dehydrogenase